MSIFAYNFSDESDLLPIFTFGISGSLVCIRSLNSSEHGSVPESFASTEEGEKYKA